MSSVPDATAADDPGPPPSSPGNRRCSSGPASAWARWVIVPAPCRPVVEPASIADMGNRLRHPCVALTRAVQHVGIVHTRPIPPELSGGDRYGEADRTDRRR